MPIHSGPVLHYADMSPLVLFSTRDLVGVELGENVGRGREELCWNALGFWDVGQWRDHHRLVTPSIHVFPKAEIPEHVVSSSLTFSHRFRSILSNNRKSELEEFGNTPTSKKSESETEVRSTS